MKIVHCSLHRPWNRESSPAASSAKADISKFLLYCQALYDGLHDSVSGYDFVSFLNPPDSTMDYFSPLASVLYVFSLFSVKVLIIFARAWCEKNPRHGRSLNALITV